MYINRWFWILLRISWNGKLHYLETKQMYFTTWESLVTFPWLLKCVCSIVLSKKKKNPNDTNRNNVKKEMMNTQLIEVYLLIKTFNAYHFVFSSRFAIKRHSQCLIKIILHILPCLECRCGPETMKFEWNKNNFNCVYMWIADTDTMTYKLHS